MNKPHIKTIKIYQQCGVFPFSDLRASRCWECTGKGEVGRGFTPKSAYLKWKDIIKERAIRQEIERNRLAAKIRGYRHRGPLWGHLVK